MKKLIALSLSLVLTVTFNYAQTGQITVEDIWSKYKFGERSAGAFNFLKDGRHYTKREKVDSHVALTKYDITSGKKVGTIFSAKDLEEAGGPKSFSRHTFSDDESKLLLGNDIERIYRRSSKGHYVVWDGNKSIPISSDEKIMYPKFNPQADKVAYVLNNNLFLMDLSTQKHQQITNDGEYNNIINGAADWVYEEEFSMSRAFWWNEAGDQIAFLRYDESAVKEFTMSWYDADEGYPKHESFKYPKAGEDNAFVTVHCYDLKSNTSKKLNLKGDANTYYPRIKWTKKSDELVVFKMNRHQNDLKLIKINTRSGQDEVMLHEQNKYFVELHDNLTFLEDAKHFIWSSERDGFNHLYLHDMNGKLKKQLTKGKWDVTRFYGVDEKKKQVYFQAAMESPINREVYCSDFSGKKARPMAAAAGSNGANFSPTFDYYIHSYSKAGEPGVYVIRDRKNEILRFLEDNSKLKKTLSDFELGNMEFKEIPVGDGVKLNAYVITPPDFDRNKEYPVLMYCYGGPGSQTVHNRWGGLNYMWFQMLAQRGYIVVSVDNRGTGARGEEFRKMTYQQLGKYEELDQTAAAKWLGEQPFVDADRIGIWGWSYGGYLSSLCLLKGNDVFKAAIAVAPVTNWKWYDTIYTERYMRTPQENEEGYENNSPVNFADRLKGNYLLIHGMADDNVHFQNAVEMASALIKANKQFDTYYYPNRNHGIYGGSTRLHLYTKMTNFILEKL